MDKFNTLNKIPKTYIFLLLTIIAALTFPFSKVLFIIIGTIAILINIKYPYNFIFILFFVVISISTNSFFIVTDVIEYNKIYSVKLGSGKIYLDKSMKVSSGDIIMGNFIIDKEKSKPFSKPVYTYFGKISIFQAPVISKILQYRYNISNYIFYASGGKISVAQALILGDKKYISDNLRDAYIISGLSHLLAMSGTHVAIITALVLTTFCFLPIKIRFIVATISVLFLIILGGFNITVIRASLFAAIIMLSYIFDIKINSKKFILFIAGIFLLISPYSINDISFLMSFGAVFGIIYLMQEGCSFFKTALITGIAATLITAPLSMYVFGTTNHLSILSTIIMTPVIYIHILFAILSLIAPNIAIVPLSIIENISNNIVFFIAKISYYGFIFKTIPFYIMFITICYTLFTLFLKGRAKLLSIISLLIIFYPSEEPEKYIFPNISPRDKAFIIYNGDRKEIFYQGSDNGFRYHLMPIIAKYGTKIYDYGTITIYGGNNNFIKIKNIGKDNFTNTCLNMYNSKCQYFFHTKSNSINKSDIKDNVTHIIWKNKLHDKSIIELEQHGSYYVP